MNNPVGCAGQQLGGHTAQTDAGFVFGVHIRLEATSRPVNTRFERGDGDACALAYGCDGIAANIQLKENFSFVVLGVL